MTKFLTEHWVEIGVIISCFHIIAKIIVAWTPTPKDNEALEKVVKLFKVVVGTIGLQPPAKKIIENQ